MKVIDYDEEALLAADQDSYVERLGVAVLRDALAEEGGNYVYSDGGRFWCGVLGLDPGFVASLAGPTNPLEVGVKMMLAEVRD